MKQDINDMISIINSELESHKPPVQFNNLIREIIEMLGKSSVDDELGNQLLSELYKFTKLGETMTSLDYRGDRTIKHSALYGIEKALSNNSLTKDDVESLKYVNDLCLDYFLNPLKLKKKERDFYSKHPDAKF